MPTIKKVLKFFFGVKIFVMIYDYLSFIYYMDTVICLLTFGLMSLSSHVIVFALFKNISLRGHQLASELGKLGQSPG